MKWGAAPLVKLIDVGTWTHQSKQALIVAVCSCIVQRCPGEEIVWSGHTIRQNTFSKRKLNSHYKHNRKMASCDLLLANCKAGLNAPSKAVLPVKICPRVEQKIQTLKVPDEQKKKPKKKPIMYFQRAKKKKSKVVGSNPYPPAAAACKQVLPKSSGVSISKPARKRLASVHPHISNKAEMSIHAQITHRLTAYRMTTAYGSSPRSRWAQPNAVETCHELLYYRRTNHTNGRMMKNQLNLLGILRINKITNVHIVQMSFNVRNIVVMY